jgi:hypothetical protein
MIQIQKEMPRQRQGQSIGQSWWNYYRPLIGSVLTYPDDVASFTAIAAMLVYPAESCKLIQGLTANDFTSDFTRQLGRGCLFDLHGYGRVREDALFESMVSKQWYCENVEVYRGSAETVLLILHHVEDKYGIEVVKEVIQGAVKELKHERVCTNRRIK